MEFLEELEWRGLIKNTTDDKMLKELLEKKATLYCGFDPTAPSLHIGHLVPVIMLSRFQKAGHRIVALVGGGTGLIGDPSGRSSARQLLTLETALENAEGLKSQLSRFLDFTDTKKTVDGIFTHSGKVIKGEISVGDAVSVAICANCPPVKFD